MILVTVVPLVLLVCSFHSNGAASHSFGLSGMHPVVHSHDDVLLNVPPVMT